MTGRFAAAMLGLSLAAAQPGLGAELPGAAASGWQSWSVPAADAAPEACCFEWRQGVAASRRCNLDSRCGAFGTSGDAAFPADDIRIYALMEAGRAQKIRALSAQCPVASESPVADLGEVAPGDSVAWLKEYIRPRSALSDDAIAAVALHRGDAAQRLLVKTATSDADEESRESAIFWLGQARIGESAGVLRDIMFDDPGAGIRRHAAFSYAQSAAPDRGAMLSRQGREDADAKVRSEAWFWMAQIEAPESEREIMLALRAEANATMRDEAVFALSQLPEDRAVAALAGILEDRSLPRHVREQALFWLAQMESDAAFDYLDRLFSDT